MQLEVPEPPNVGRSALPNAESVGSQHPGPAELALLRSFKKESTLLRKAWAKQPTWIKSANMNTRQ